MFGFKSHFVLYILVAILLVSMGSACQRFTGHPSMQDRTSIKPSPSPEGIGRWIEWQEPTTTADLYGVALVIHGLNLKPSKMNAISATLTAAGIAVAQLNLQGHREIRDTHPGKHSERLRIQSFKTVSHGIWYKQAFHAFRHVEKRSRRKQVPLFLVAYSYGGLLGTDLFASEPSVKFDKMVLFSPALTVTFGYGLKWLYPFPRLVIPSFAPKEYRANWGTPVAAYRALFETIDHFKIQMNKKINVPTLVFIDPDDELVSYRHLKQLVCSENLTQWQILPVAKSSSNQPLSQRHLIIDADSLGDQSWEKVKEKMIQHLLTEHVDG